MAAESFRNNPQIEDGKNHGSMPNRAQRWAAVSAAAAMAISLASFERSAQATPSSKNEPIRLTGNTTGDMNTFNNNLMIAIMQRLGGLKRQHNKNLQYRNHVVAPMVTDKQYLFHKKQIDGSYNTLSVLINPQTGKPYQTDLYFHTHAKFDPDDKPGSVPGYKSVQTLDRIVHPPNYHWSEPTALIEPMPEHTLNMKRPNSVLPEREIEDFTGFASDIEETLGMPQP